MRPLCLSWTQVLLRHYSSIELFLLLQKTEADCQITCSFTMHSTMLITLLAILPNRLLAIPTESLPSDPSLLVDRAIGSSCSTPYGSGSCQETSSCATSGFHIAGYCPNDPTNVQCCVKQTCTTDLGSGLCMNTDSTCSGEFVPGACPGPNTVQVRYNLLAREVVRPILNVGIVLRRRSY